jgi:hypothetical protein
VFVRVTPSRLALDGDDLYRVATQLESAARAAQSALSSTGGMAGNEDSAQEFIDGYGDGATNTLNAAGSYAQTLRGLDTLLQDTANAYKDAGTVGTLVAVPARSPSSTPGSAETYSVPSAKAPGPTTPLGEFGEFVMDALAQIGVVLPDADTGKLGDAASAWSSFGSSITSAANELDGTLTNLASMDIPQGDDIRTSRDLVVQKLRDIAKAADGPDSLSDFCTKQKQAVEAMWEEIGWFLGQMAAEIALDLGLGALLSVATGGLAAPAVVAKIATTVMRWVIKIAQLVQKLVALTRMNALAAKLLLRALAEGTQSAVATVTVQAAVNQIRGPEHAQSLLAVGLGSFAGGGIAGRFGDGGAHVLRINARTGVSRVASNTAVGVGEGAIDGLTDGVVQAAVQGDMSTFDPIASGVMGSLIGGAARPIGGGTRPNAPSTGSGGGANTNSPGVDVPSSGSPDAPSAPSSVDAPSAPGVDAPAAPTTGGGAPSSPAPATGGSTNTDAPDAPVVDGAGDASTPVDASTSVDIPSGGAPTGAGGDTSSPSGGGGSVPDVSVPDAPAPGDGGSPATPDSSVPSIPDTSTPSTPDSSVPSTPDTSVPSTPDTSTPSIPDTSVPSSPDTSVPSSPDTSVPSAPDASTPSSPDSNAPSAPDSSTPSAPDASTPDAGAPSTPDASTPDADAPSTPDTATPDVSAPSAPDAVAPSAPDASTPDSPAPADGSPAGVAPAGAGAAAAAQAPSSATTSTPDADSSAFEAAVAADAAAADADASAATDAPDSSPDAATPDADATVDPNAIDADDAMAAGAIAAGAVGVVGLHAGASGGKAPTAPTSPNSPSNPGSPSAPGTPDANSPDATTPDANTPDANTPDANTPDANAPDANTPDANTPDAEQPDAGSNTTERTTAEIDAALAAINPNFDPFDPTNGYATNCGNTSSILNDFLNGNPSREAPTGTLTVPEMEARTGQPQTPMTPDQIADSLRDMGAGSHCVVGIDRSTGDGHWFNAYFDGTTVWSIDAQTGTRSPWPPNEPNATTWDASIRPEDVADPKTPDTDAQNGDGSTPDGSTPDGSTPDASTPDGSTPAAPDSDPSMPDAADADARDGESPATRGAAPDAADVRPRIPEYSVEFTPNVNHDRVEFERQLDLQETGINELSIAEFLANRDAYRTRAENGDTGRDPSATALQKEAREVAISDWTTARAEELIESGVDFEEAYDRADREATAWAATQAALHSPDQVAGGFADRITGLGDSRVNSSIGAQWKYRIANLEAAVRAASEGMTPQERADTLLNIRLTIAS